MTRLDSFRSDTTSQCGEDGMIAELVRRLGIDTGWCVELGAWDGRHLSNTWSLWSQQGWSAVLLEGDPGRAGALDEATEDRSDVHVVCAFVEPDGERSLDVLLGATSLPERFEVLSVDIDGDDFHLWENLRRYEPRIVVIEYNASFPPHVEFVQPRGESIGSSGRAFVVLAERKGYSLLAATPSNLVFARTGDVAASGLEPVAFEDVFDPAGLAVVYSDFVGHHYVLEPAQWGYQATTRHPHRTVAAAMAEVAAVARRRGAAAVPLVARGYRSLRYRGAR